MFVACSLRLCRLGNAFSSSDDKYNIVFKAAGLALLDIICIPFAAFCCVAFWRLPSVFSTSTSDSVHTKLIEAAGNALVDILLLPAVLLHALFPWRLPALFTAGFGREAILLSAAQGLVDLPFALMALVCCFSLIQTFGMVGDVGHLSLAPLAALPASCCDQIWSVIMGNNMSLRDCIMDRVAALFVTILALSAAPLSLYRIFQIKFSLIGGNAEASLKLLEVIILHTTMQDR